MFFDISILPLTDTLPVTSNPDNSYPISIRVDDNKFVATIVSAIIVLLDESWPVKLPPERGR